MTYNKSKNNLQILIKIFGIVVFKLYFCNIEISKYTHTKK